MKVRCNLCISFKLGFCNNKAKAKRGRPVHTAPKKRRYCNHFELNEAEAERILSQPKPKTSMRPDDYWMSRKKRRKLKEEYEEEIKDTYISQFSSTAEKGDTIETTKDKEAGDDEKLF